MKKIISFSLFFVLLMTSCTDQEKDQCPMFLEVEAKEYGNYYINIIEGVVPLMNTINIYNKLKNPAAESSSLNDVILERIDTYWRRIDGGTIAPKKFTLKWTIPIPSEGQATLNNVPLMAAEQLLEMPFIQLFPGYGGIDKETGNTTIRCQAETYFYARSAQGCDIVSEPMYTTFEFYYEEEEGGLR